MVINWQIICSCEIFFPLGGELEYTTPIVFSLSLFPSTPWHWNHHINIISLLGVLGNSSEEKHSITV